MHWDGRITEKVETKDKEDKDQENKDIENKDNEEDNENKDKDKEEDKYNKDNVLEMVTPMLLTRTQTTRLFITRLRQRNVSLESEIFRGLRENVLICLIMYIGSANVYKCSLTIFFPANLDRRATPESLIPITTQMLRITARKCFLLSFIFCYFSL